MTADHLSTVFELAEAAYPLECCGVLVGRSDRGQVAVTGVVATRNILEAPDRYEIEPEGLLAAMRAAEEKGAEVVGYFHSHPDRPATPSARDEASAWSRVSYLIVEVAGGRAIRAKSWRRRDRRMVEEAIVTEDRESCPGASDA